MAESKAKPDHPIKLCSFEACGRKVYAKGLCTTHYKQGLRGETLRPLNARRPNSGGCTFVGCAEAHYCQGLCVAHYFQHKRGGGLRKVKPQGPNEVVIAGELAWLILTDNFGEEAGRTCLDAADLPLVAGRRWTLTRGYVTRRAGAARQTMHRILMGLASGEGRSAAHMAEVEHINGDTLDNRRGNLRVHSPI